MGLLAQQTMTDVLPQTEPASVPRHQLLNDQVPHPSITSHPAPIQPLLPALATTANANDAGQPAVKEDRPEAEDDGVIACICAFQIDDGNTIQCDKCMRWQHILCYYPPPEQTPDEASAHYCLDCQPRHLDARKATERQRKVLNEVDVDQQLDKKSHTKSHKKKTRDSPSINTGQPNLVDRQGHTPSGDAKSAGARDGGPPAAKRPKIAHKSSDKTNNSSSRKRGANSTNNTPVTATRSQSPDTIIIPQYSTDFIRLFDNSPPQVETATNLMNDIAITNSLSEWLVDSKAVSKATRGLAPGDIFQRWNGRIEEIPGSPEVSVRWVEDPRYAADGLVPRWAQVVIEDQIASGAFIGELRGRICHIDHYHSNPQNRWHTLRHPLPFVFFHPQLPICIDARQEGSIFRFVRRSCNPNAKLQTIITEGNEYHFCFMALRDIMPGEEVSVAWSVPESISEKIKTSFGQTNNVQPNVREAICEWVSRVLANCGLCACAGPAHCLMAHYDRRGQPMPKARKGKNARLSQLDGGVDGARSRSASEATYKQESYDDGQGDQSNSATPGSDSRDMTPHIHDPTSAGGTLLPEMSERERKKLMREEEMFRKQEQANDRQRKKRPSGGSNLNTPITATPVRGRGSVDMFDRPAQRRSTGGSANSPGGSKSTLGKRKGGSASATSRRKSSAARPPRPVYVDASVQCDMDQDLELARSPTVPKRKYLPLTHKLLRRCTLNNLERRASLAPEVVLPEQPQAQVQVQDGPEAMDVDSKGPNGTEVTNGVDAADHSRSGSAALVSPEVGQGDTAMPDATVDATLEAASSPRSVVFSPALQTNEAPVDTRPSSQPPLASIDAAVAPVKVEDVGPLTAVAGPSPSDVEMGPPASVPEPDGPQTQEPAPSTDESRPATSSTSLNTPAPPTALLSPGIAATVAPSPVRKKLSLKDYTKRSKARPSSGGEMTSGGMLTPSSTLTADPMSAVLSRESNAEKMATDTFGGEQLSNGDHVKPDGT